MVKTPSNAAGYSFAVLAEFPIAATTITSLAIAYSIASLRTVLAE